MKKINLFEDLEGKSGIYYFKNIINEKLYIGQAKDLRNRIMGHLRELRKNDDDCLILQNSWNKYGEENFEIGVLEFCKVEKLHIREIHLIKKLKSQKPNGYNISPGGIAPMLGRRHTKERNKKMSIAMMGNTNTKGRKQSQKEKDSRVISSLGSKHSNTSSKYVGVYWDRFNNSWHAEIMYLKIKHSLGYHKTEISAALAYNDGLIKYYGYDKSKLNKITKKEIKKNQKIIDKLEQEHISRQSSIYIGVIFDTRCNLWRTRITIKNKRICLGYFKNEIDSAISYDNYVIQNDLSRKLNFPNGIKKEKK